MNVLSIFGGPRKKGNTATILGWVEEALRDLGHHTECVFLSSKKVKGCLGCLKCDETNDEPGCIQKDDGADIIKKMISSDAVIFASPLYYWGFSAQMKALIDRCYCLFRGECDSPGHISFVEGQHHGLIVTAADSFVNNVEHLLTSFHRMHAYNKTKNSGELLVHNCTDPDKLTEEIKENAVRFANQFFDHSSAPYSILIPGEASH